MKILLIFFLMLLISCEDKDTLVNNNDKISVFESNNYPLKVGNWWKYQVIDSTYYPIKTSVDTTEFKILSVRDSVNIKLYKCAWIKNEQVIDSSIFMLKDGSLTYYSLSPWIDGRYMSNYQLIFPLKKGNIWYSDWWTNYFVNSGNDSTYILGKYYNSFQIRMINKLSDHEGTSMIFNLANDIGMIYSKVYTHQQFDVFNNREFRLIEFKLN